MAEPTMEEVVNVEEELQPCDICGRTFLPKPLEKHMRVCERNASKKRKIFDSQKQRVDGTELASFHLPVYIKKPITSESPKKSSKWKEKHLELVSAIRAARNVNGEMSSSGSTLNNPRVATSGGDRCPSCDRQFGPRAYDRHVEWCKERNTRVQKSPADVLLAKERLAARTKYKVPLPTKSKRSIIKDKYSPTLGNRADSFGSTKSNSCSSLERTSSTSKAKYGHKTSEVTTHDHGDGTDTIIVEEKVTKKTEKEKNAREKRTLPEIKPAVDLKSPRTSRLLTLKQKINTVEINTSVEGMTVSHLTNCSENKETKRLVTWKDTVNGDTLKNNNVACPNKNAKLGKGIINKVILQENDNVPITNLKFDSKPCIVLTSMMEKNQKEIKKLKTEVCETSLHKKSKSKMKKIHDSSDLLLSTKAIKTLLQPKFTRLPVGKLKNIQTLTSKMKLDDVKQEAFAKLVDEDLENLSNSDAETDLTSDYKKDSKFVSSNDEDLGNNSKLPVRKFRHSLSPRLHISGIALQSDRDHENHSKLPVRKLKHEHSFSSDTCLDKNDSGTSLNEDLRPLTRKLRHSNSFISQVHLNRLYKSPGANSDLETDILSDGDSKSRLIETEKENSRTLIENSKNLCPKVHSKTKVSENILQNSDSHSKIIINGTKQKLVQNKIKRATLEASEKSLTSKSSATNCQTGGSSDDEDSLTDRQMKHVTSEGSFDYKISNDTFAASTLAEDEIIYKKNYSGGQLNSDDLFQAAKRMCEAEKYAGPCSSSSKKTFDKESNYNVEAENKSEESNNSETNTYKFDNDNIEEFKKLDYGGPYQTESDSRTIDSEEVIMLCKPKESLFDLSSCDESDNWNVALSLARIEQCRRNCSSAVYVQNKNSDSDFVTYTETDLNKFGCSDWDGTMSNRSIFNLDKTNSSAEGGPAKRRKLIDKVLTAASPSDIDSDILSNEYVNNSISVEENKLNFTNSSESLGCYVSSTEEEYIEDNHLSKPHRKISPRLLALINLIKNERKNDKHAKNKDLVTLSREDCRKLFELDPATVKDMESRIRLPTIYMKNPPNTCKSIDDTKLSLPPISKIPINKTSPDKSLNDSRKVLKPTLPEVVPKSFISCKSTSDKKKSANPVKRSVSIRESPNKPNLKSKQDVEHYFNRQEKKSNKPKVDQLKHPEGLEETDDPKADDLFSIDYEMYEEYKKYEELYLKEKQLQHQNSEIPLGELTEYDDIEFLTGCNTSKSNTDSAYNSLNRSNPKIRSKLNKLNPLEYQKPNITPEGSPSSSSSEAGAMTNMKKRISKFCHECGNKYPIETAKFCVECGAKRLTL